MIYFDSAATSLLRPSCVKEAVVQALDTFGNPSRSAHKASLDATRVVTECRDLLAKYFHAPDPSHVIFTLNATHALNLVISSLTGHIIMTEADHNSVLRPVYQRGNYSILPCDATGNLQYHLLESLIKSDTTTVIMTHASNVTGNLYDLERVGQFCHDHNLTFVVDGSQTAGLIPIPMDQYQIHALCMAGHKSLLGPQGTGALILRNFDLSPLMVGGSGVYTFLEEQPDTYPEHLEAGTLNAHGIAGLLAGLKYLQALPVSYTYNQSMEYARTFYHGIKNLSGISIYSNWETDPHVPVICLNLDQMDSSQLAFTLFEEYDIAVRAGFHCAPLMHKALGTQEIGSVRFSFSHLNTKEEIQRGILALTELSSL